MLVKVRIFPFPAGSISKIKMVWVVKLFGSLGVFAVRGNGDGLSKPGLIFGVQKSFQVVGLRQGIGSSGSWHNQGSQAAALSTQDKYLNILS